MLFQKSILVLIFSTLSFSIFAHDFASFPEKPVAEKAGNQLLAEVIVADASAVTNKQPLPTPTPLPAEYNDPTFTNNAFRTTDEETELLLQEILNLSSDIAILSEEDTGAQKNQVIVIVTLNAPKLFDLSYIELKIDSQTVAAYQYTDSEVQAMQLGGGHRIYKTNLSTGIHRLSAFILGRVPKDPDYKRDVLHRFIAGISRTVIEINIDSKDSSTYPNLVISEWN